VTGPNGSAANSNTTQRCGADIRAQRLQARGNVRSTRPLAAALVDAGHEVRIATGPAVQERHPRHGLKSAGGRALTVQPLSSTRRGWPKRAATLHACWPSMTFTPSDDSLFGTAVGRTMPEAARSAWRVCRSVFGCSVRRHVPRVSVGRVAAHWLGCRQRFGVSIKFSATPGCARTSTFPPRSGSTSRRRRSGRSIDHQDLHLPGRLALPRRSRLGFAVRQHQLIQHQRWRHWPPLRHRQLHQLEPVDRRRVDSPLLSRVKPSPWSFMSAVDCGRHRSFPTLGLCATGQPR
jgi:hypothetical protein